MNKLEYFFIGSLAALVVLRIIALVLTYDYVSQPGYAEANPISAYSQSSLGVLSYYLDFLLYIGLFASLYALYYFGFLSTNLVVIAIIIIIIVASYDAVNDLVVAGW